MVKVVSTEFVGEYTLDEELYNDLMFSVPSEKPKPPKKVKSCKSKSPASKKSNKK